MNLTITPAELRDTIIEICQWAEEWLEVASFGVDSMLNFQTIVNHALELEEDKKRKWIETLLSDSGYRFVVSYLKD